MTALDGLAAGPLESWMFLGVRVDVLTSPSAPVAVSEALLPLGASPPLHVHEGLDDSFYVLEGRMVVRCGEDVSLAGPGTWVQFPSGRPHTFRVVEGPLRTLQVHSDGSFLDAVRDIGHPVADGDAPHTGGGPSPEELGRRLAAHGITTVGPPMEHDEAMAHLGRLGRSTITAP